MALNKHLTTKYTKLFHKGHKEKRLCSLCSLSEPCGYPYYIEDTFWR